VIPDSAGPPCAIVAAAGPGAYEGGTFVPTKVKEGDRVLLDAPVGVVGKFRWAGKTYRICQERYFCAVLPGDQSFAESSPELTVPAPKLILPS
jgi:co-chaperonin GroES (HSP10)